MAQKMSLRADDALADESDRGLDRAIDDLRGVLKQDAGGIASRQANSETDDAMTAGTNKAVATADDFGSDFALDGAEISGGAGSADPFDMMLQDAPAFDGAPTAALAAPAGVTDFGEEPLNAGAAGRRRSNMDLIMDIPIDMEIVLGTSRLPVSGLMSLTEGSLIALDRKIGEPVEIVVNGRLFGRGEITVLEGDETRFGVKLIEIVARTGS